MILIVAGAIAAALIGLLFSVVGNLLSDRIKPPTARTLAFWVVVAILLTAGAAAFPQIRARLFEHDAATPGGAASQDPSSGGTPTTKTPKPHRKSASSGTSPPTATSPGKTTPKLSGYIASARSSRDSQADNHPPAKIRFWTYAGADEIGSVRFAEGGYAGRYAWAPVAIGKDCSDPYVRFIFGGIPAGRYAITVHIPDVPGMAHQVDIGKQVVDEAAHRGEWLQLSVETVTKDSGGGTDFEVEMSQSASSLGDDAGCRAGSDHVAFDAVRMRPLS